MSVISGTLGALAQRGASKDAAKAQQRAADQQTQALLQMYNQTRQDFSPFLQTGIGALGELSGYTPVSGGMQTPAMPQQYGSMTGGLQQLQSPNGGMSPFGQLYTGNVQYYGGTGNTDGMSTQQGTLGLPQSGQLGSLGGQPQQMGQGFGTTYQKTGPGADPTGGASKYFDLLDNFKVNEDDEVFKWRQGQAQKSIEQAAAARGMYNSRPTINALADANMALTGSEVERQQNQLRNLYGMAMGLGGANYNKLIDLVKIGQGAAGTAGGFGQNVAQGLSSVYGNMGNANAMNSLMQGQNMSNMFGGISSGLQNAGMLYGLGGGFGKDGFSMAKLFG